MSKKRVSIVIPVYNEEQILESAVENLKKTISEFSDDFDFELILAENGSKDNTLAKGEELSKQDSFVTIFHHPEPDYGLALQAGLRRAKGEIVVCATQH